MMGFWAWRARRKITKARKASQPLSVAVADSLIEKPNDWNYDSEEKWLNNDKADLAISAPQRAASSLQINRRYSNGDGSMRLAEHSYSWDRWLIDRAYLKWKDATALERERDRETWKAKAMVKLAA